MYKFNREGNVDNLTTGQMGIHPGVWLWRVYQEWLAEGNVTEPYQTAEEAEAEAVRIIETERLAARRLTIESAINDGGLRQYSLVQAEDWINEKVNTPESLEAKIDSIRDILLKFLPGFLPK
jgi:hypothetical protein